MKRLQQPAPASRNNNGALCAGINHGSVQRSSGSNRSTKAAVFSVKSIFLLVIALIVMLQTNTLIRSTRSDVNQRQYHHQQHQHQEHDNNDSVMLPPPLRHTTKEKSQFDNIDVCSSIKQPIGTKYAKVLKNIKVHDETLSPRASTSTRKQPKILCFLITNRLYHTVRLPGVLQTWGRKCAKLVISSDITHKAYGTISIQDIIDEKNNITIATTKSFAKKNVHRPNKNSKSGYVQLWNRLNQTVQYVWDTYKNDGYDWYLKADDDSYIIYENLIHLLTDPKVVYKSETLHMPLIYGRQYSWVSVGDLTSGKKAFRQFFNFTLGNSKGDKYIRRRQRLGFTKMNSTAVNGEFRTKFYSKFTNMDEAVIYPHGGAGYIMNGPYMKQFSDVLKGPDTLRGIPPEDLAHGAVMKYHDIVPQYSRDENGLERFHPESPTYMYDQPVHKIEHMVGTIAQDGIVENGTRCCSPYTISFHHVTAQDMIDMERMLYC